MRTYRRKLIITSIITLLPMLVGLILWNKLPDTIATHWGADNQANGWSSKEMVVFGMPALLTFFHLIAVGVTMADPKRKNISKKMMNIVFWIVPVVSWVVFASVYATALGISVNIGLIGNILVGILFIVIGYFMPKSGQSYTVGIKLPWTLNDEENWNRTNRVSGYLFMICGIVFIVNAFFLSIVPMIISVLMLLIIPMIYSYIIYQKSKSKK